MYNALNVNKKPIIVPKVVFIYGFLFFTIVIKNDKNIPTTITGVT